MKEDWTNEIQRIDHHRSSQLEDRQEIDELRADAAIVDRYPPPIDAIDRSQSSTNDVSDRSHDKFFEEVF